MNYPSTDLQFVAQMLIRTRTQDQITAAEAARLDQIAEKGFSSMSDAPPPSISEAETAIASGATRVQR